MDPVFLLVALCAVMLAAFVGASRWRKRWYRHAREKVRRKYGQNRVKARILAKLRRAADEAIKKREADGKTDLEVDAHDDIILINQVVWFALEPEASPSMSNRERVLCVQVKRGIDRPSILISRYRPDAHDYEFDSDNDGLEDAACVITECIRAFRP